MSNISIDEKSQILNEILLSRRTTRKFKPDYPPEEMVRKVISAGLLAPFACAAVQSFKNGYFRRFFVIKKGTSSMEKVSKLLIDHVRLMAKDLDTKRKTDPTIEEVGRAWAKRLDWFSREGHVPGVTNAPYYIVIAEPRGIPAIGLLSIAHCQQNMWLKANAMDLGFQIVSVTEYMADDLDFCSMLEIKPGEWYLNGCALGYPEIRMHPYEHPSVDDVTTWLE